jgi:hypothetical protein
MFRRACYHNVYLVDEHRTSCRCHNCKDVVREDQVIGGQCVTFRKCKNPRPWRTEGNIVRHGLLMCQTCHGFRNPMGSESIEVMVSRYQCLTQYLGDYEGYPRR